jgi:hypothetical protein
MGSDEDGSGSFDTLRLVPFVVDVHDEPAWQRLLRLLPKAGEHARGFGIPSGAGVLYHPDYSVEPIRHPLTEVELGETGPRQALVFPGETVEGSENAPGPVTMTQEEILENVLRDLDPGEPGPDDPVN